jgi:hypothetical protein
MLKHPFNDRSNITLLHSAERHSDLGMLVIRLGFMRFQAEGALPTLSSPPHPLFGIKYKFIQMPLRADYKRRGNRLEL